MGRFGGAWGGSQQIWGRSLSPPSTTNCSRGHPQNGTSPPQTHPDPPNHRPETSKSSSRPQTHPGPTQIHPSSPKPPASPPTHLQLPSSPSQLPKTPQNPSPGLPLDLGEVPDPHGGEGAVVEVPGHLEAGVVRPGAGNGVGSAPGGGSEGALGPSFGTPLTGAAPPRRARGRPAAAARCLSPPGWSQGTPGGHGQGWGAE